jgi:purine-nucleoside phosphorylase
LTLQQEIRAIHLKPAAELAERVLLPGDPHRALAVAQHLLDGPKMFNHRRGLWGYTGIAADGELLTVQATGMGGPSAAIVTVELGDLVAAETVLSADGASAALGANGALGSDPELLARLVAGGARPGTVVSSDLFYDPREGEAGAWVERGASVVEMEAAAILQVAARRGVAAACVLAVTDVPAPGGSRRVDADELERIGLRLGDAGYDSVTVSRS